MSGCPFDVEPYAISEIITSPGIVNLNYTNQDYWSLKSALATFIQEYFGEYFTDFVESSLAIMLVECWAFVADTLSFKIDQIANEVFIDTVVEIDNAFRICKLVGFTPTPPIAASSLWTATIPEPLTAPVYISTPFRISATSADGAIEMELFAADADNNPLFDQDIEIAIGNDSTSAIVGLEGITLEQTSRGTGVTNQVIATVRSSVIYDSVRVVVDGAEWERVDYFTDSQPRREFRVEFDSEYRAYVIFGNNRAGLMPSATSSITVTYRMGGGIRGNIVTNAVSRTLTVPINVAPYGAAVTFTNYTKGQNGYNGDGLAEIKDKLPKYLTTQNRCVSGSDYQVLAEQFATPYNGQIGKCIAALRQYGCAANIVDLFVLAKDGTSGLILCSNELKTALYREIESKKMLTDVICIRDGSVINVDVTLDVTVPRARRKFEEETRTRVANRIESFFGLQNWNYGQTLRDTDLLRVISDMTEITSSSVTFTPDNGADPGQIVTARYYEIIRPDDITLSIVYE